MTATKPRAERNPNRKPHRRYYIRGARETRLSSPKQEPWDVTISNALKLNIGAVLTRLQVKALVADFDAMESALREKNSE